MLVVAATMPHSWMIQFWAKSTMFNNRVSKFFMDSCCAIPVARNPNSNHTLDTSPHALLFADTSLALAQHNVIAIFPEGTSYTFPSIVQIHPGAAWAVVEYFRYARKQKLATMATERDKSIYLGGKGRHGEKTELKVLPVGIVYDDKSKFMSRVSVAFRIQMLMINATSDSYYVSLHWSRSPPLVAHKFSYGNPIDMDSYQRELFDENLDPEVAAKSVVRKLNTEIETRLLLMSVNAPDW